MSDSLCSYRRNELFGIMISVCVGFRYIEICKCLSVRHIVRSRKLMDLCCTFFIVKFMVDCSLLNSLSV
jgi:hypothetical protein